MLSSKVLFLFSTIFALLDELLSNIWMVLILCPSLFILSLQRICCVVYVIEYITSKKKSWTFAPNRPNKDSTNSKRMEKSLVLSFLWLPITFYSYSPLYIQFIYCLHEFIWDFPLLSSSVCVAQYTNNELTQKKEQTKNVLIGQSLHSNYLCWFKVKTQ